MADFEGIFNMKIRLIRINVKRMEQVCSPFSEKICKAVKHNLLPVLNIRFITE